jgi:outer membrane protein OmpA-like peptidoglycan-associated protein
MMFYHPTDNGKGGFRFRKKVGDEWIPDEVLSLEFDNESRYVESCLSASGSIILFTAKTKRNVAYQPSTDERDIYVCLRNAHDKWSKPVNLGKAVNTAGDEFSPYLAADERTLYFATNGKPGYGRVDIFMTKRLDDSWTNWSPPVNLGPEINTSLFDAYFSVPASGDFAYLVSFHRSGDTDLIRVKLPPELKPDPVLLMKVTVKDSINNKPVVARILVKENGVETDHTTTDQRYGESKMILQGNRKYVLYALAKGYHRATDTVAVGELKHYQEKSISVLLSPMHEGDNIAVNRILFEQSKSTLTSATILILQDLVDWLQANPSTVIEISGHTDNHGTADRLQELSEDRVRKVKEYLTGQGIGPSRIVGRAYGASKPLVKNDTEVHREMNRRVEFRVIRP